MGTYCETETGAAIGAGATDTFSTVGSDITLRSEGGLVLGFIVNGQANASTATEAYQFQVKFDVGQLGFGDVLVTGNTSVGEGIASQSGGFGVPARFYPAKIPFRGGEHIKIEAAHHGPAPTAGLNVQAAVLYSIPPHPPAEWMARVPSMFGMQGSDSEANAAVTANNTAITALEIPSWAEHICGFTCAAAQDAAPRTAEDLVCGLAFKDADFKDFVPQEYPFVGKYPNLAGTLVGKGIALPVVTWPAWIPTGGKYGTITPYTLLATAVTDAHSITADVHYTSL